MGTGSFPSANVWSAEHSPRSAAPRLASAADVSDVYDKLSVGNRYAPDGTFARQTAVAIAG